MDVVAMDVVAMDTLAMDTLAMDVVGMDVVGADASDVFVACTPTSCAAGQSCCAFTGACYPSACLACCMARIDAGGTDVTTGGCTDNSMCAATDYCAGSACGTPGACTARPNICSALFNPVCGCDGRTYPNSCYAAEAGVRVAGTGACPDAGSDAATDAPTDVVVDRCAAVHCTGGLRCCPGTGACYDPRCLACCMP
jgi:hypothetical protein